MIRRNPRLLFLACYFPPAQGSACVRTWNIAKHLARLEWNVTVVTPHPSIWRHVDDARKVSRELDRENVTRIFTGHRWRCLDPGGLMCWNQSIGWVMGGICRRIARYFAVNSGIGWIKEAELACESLTSNDVDVILATGPPFATFSLAKRLSIRLGRPYVLDYRDPWVVHPDSTLSALEATRRLERQLIEDCDAVTAVSGSLLKGTCLPSPKLHVVTNGYDPEELAQVKPCDFGHFAIVYAGVFRPPVTVITPVMQALKLLKEKKAAPIEWKFHYYGPHGDHVLDEAHRFEVVDNVVIHGRVGRADALSAVRGSGATIVITSVLEVKEEWEKGIVTGKLFEPLGMQVPILLIGPTGIDVDDIIEDAGLAYKVTPSDIDGIVTFLEKLMSGNVPSVKKPELYAWPNTIKALDAVLRNAIVKTLGNEKGGTGSSNDALSCPMADVSERIYKRSGLN